MVDLICLVHNLMNHASVDRRNVGRIVLENAVCGDLLSHNVKKSGEAQCRTQVND